MRYLGIIRVGASVFRASDFLLVGCHDTLCGSELLLQEMDDLLFLACFGGGAFVHAGLIEGLARVSHSGEKDLLPLLCGSCGG
jgi:hypothetical protein